MGLAVWYAIVVGICVVVTGVVVVTGFVVGLRVVIRLRLVVVITSIFSAVVLIGAADVVSRKGSSVLSTAGVGCSMLLLCSGMGLSVLQTYILSPFLICNKSHISIGRPVVSFPQE